MRDPAQVLMPVLAELEKRGLRPDQAALLCDVELGLLLHERLNPAEPVGAAWVLFCGIPYARGRGLVADAAAATSLRSARFTLWTLRRRTAWHDALDAYQKLDEKFRAFDVPGTTALVTRRPIAGIADERFDHYDRLLATAPPFKGGPATFAARGPHRFQAGRTTVRVDLPDTALDRPEGHDLGLRPAGEGKPIEVVWRELIGTARSMDEIEPHGWERRMRSVRLRTRGKLCFRPASRFTIAGIEHLLGIVGAGKSTLRDVLTVHLARRGRRVTVVVGDVAEALELVRLYNRYTDDLAAPILGASGKQRHAQRMHRRLASRGEANVLAHDDPGFAYLSTSCTLNVHIGDQDDVLAFNQAPCTRLHRRTVSPEAKREWSNMPVTCPYWAACPRHRGAHELVTATIWVSTPAGLVDAAVPWPQNAERIRYFEAACRRSDLVIVDEADRVQMQLDRMFAPAVALVGGSDRRSLLDELNTHKIRELSEGARTQLSDRDVEDWTAAVNTITAATDRLYAMLVASRPLRDWVRTGYFSAWTLQLRLIEEYTKGLPGAEEARRQLTERLDDFRDNPFGDRARPEVPELTVLVNELLTTGRQQATRRKLSEFMVKFFDLSAVLARLQAAYDAEQGQPKSRKRGRKPAPHPDSWLAEKRGQFEFTLLLSALEPKLALMNAMWPRVESVLKLAFNDMYRRPPDYGPIVPEAPMGNVLGFQFIIDGPPRHGVQSGELRYFRCSGIGRELLRAIPGLPEVDGRPRTNLLLMSGSSWAGSSSRYHVPVPVGAILLPDPKHVKAVVDGTEMRLEFLDGGDGREPLTLSGADLDERPDILRRMATRLGEKDDDGSLLDRELRVLPDARRKILLLVGSYEEAAWVADTLHTLDPRWKGNVLRLVSDDDEVVTGTNEEHHAPVLRRGDVGTLDQTGAQILVAPLLAVERGHNILNDNKVAAIGTVYFLARPNPRPDDLGLAVHAVNDWLVRFADSPEFATQLRAASDVDEGALAIREEARRRWYRALSRSLAWSRLGADRDPVTWDLLVLVWQVIGRLVRGGVHARVVFVDAAFAPETATGRPAEETRETSLLHNIYAVLTPYLTPGSAEPAHDRYIVDALYRPLWAALDRLLTNRNPECTP
ncbi:hypothetical protein [Amycolatopsis sp. SID8362]|uniref:pPIWI_RE_Z domain-containing protein n=1 Tax=Amycolatopsis sp. SID8362 TaxID=2690346 RepID=UPI00136C46FF|nr:hypothetical protein [Amycolatopsis sp. SID8362]NBH06791.1 hypothetical protein [Amycolatopsis sp. SID8362]NED43488.1 hypothetical protein [Amycolatopsis sp. SID8362]